MKIKKAVFPVAGLGTRFLPATKANPKEMLPIVDKPLIQYAVEEAVASGIKQLIFVTSATKRAIEDHFDKNIELEDKLEAANKLSQLADIRAIIPEHVECFYVRQSEQKGLGHAVLCAKNIVGNEPFAVLLADDLIQPQSDYCLEQMCDIYDKTNRSVIAVEEVPGSDVDKYGVIAPDADEEYINIKSIVEKPLISEAPSNLAVVGRYIFNPSIFAALEKTPKGRGNEVQLTDAIALTLAKEKFIAHQFSGKRFDCGSKLGFLQATVEYGLKHEECAPEFKSYLEGCLSGLESHLITA